MSTMWWIICKLSLISTERIDDCVLCWRIDCICDTHLIYMILGFGCQEPLSSAPKPILSFYTQNTLIPN